MASTGTDSTTSATAPTELTPAEMSERSGVSLDTLRYYEREGLIDPVSRAANGHRRYSVDDVVWVEVLRCLRDTGMTIDELRHYCDLGAQGDATETERRDLLLDHRAEVEGQIALRTEALRLVDHELASSPPHTDHVPTPSTTTQENHS